VNKASIALLGDHCLAPRAPIDVGAARYIMSPSGIRPSWWPGKHGHAAEAWMETRTQLVRLMKTLFFSTPLWRYFLPVMKFDMTIAQLNFITTTLETVRTAGAVLEIGVGGGATSIAINEFMKQRSIARPFYAVDTFSGFTKEDVDFEKKQRDKSDSYLGYRTNNRAWYSKTLIAHGIEHAHVIQADAKQLDYSRFAPLAFCLLDIDLYKPVESVLPRLYDVLEPGGIIIVDDCALEESLYDGAGEAYRKFCARIGVVPELVHDKLGVIRKPALEVSRTHFAAVAAERH
jgi:predicted O-methyltransferase YrrM